jgi:tRNA A-37 threonylcarbamoyl transferase component Bud32
VSYRRIVASDREQDLAQTATATASAKAGAAGSIGPILGRYRLERKLGAGAMGVVHAAFDPDLERRIALKVLRSATATHEARERLMREARAMARLAHPNVVTVHEVGTAGDRDFVAMELIHGETLADWLRSSKRSRAAIIDAFMAAGRGLAAAHAAGIVHRDFKPHNVLRSHEGRIVVTDFGLARQAEGVLPAAVETMLPATHATAVTRTSSSLPGITATGSLLGTPAYMPPEQWSGGAITPATDQFAYCVALWEAFAGERPYQGQTLEELRLQIARGPAVLDASRIPRRVRSVLRRGMDPAPGQRWPSMNALLVQLARAERRPRVAFAIAGGTLAAAAVFVAMRSDRAPWPACEAPARDVATVWSPVIAADLRAKTSDAHAAVLEAAYRAWQAARTQACNEPLRVKQAQLQCLDGVLGRFDALRQGYARVPAAAAEDLQGELIDPEICRKSAAADIPRLMIGPTPDVIAAYELYGRSETEHKPSDAELAALSSKLSADPCARVIATLAFKAASKDVPRARLLVNDAMSTVDQCGDERLRTDLLIQAAQYQWELPVVGPKGEAATRQAQVTAKRVMQPDVEAALASLSIEIAQQQDHWEEAFRFAETQIAGYGARGLPVRQTRAVITRNNLRIAHAEPADLEAVMADAQHWRSVAMANHQPAFANQLDRQAALARFWLGDVPAAHAELLRLWKARPRTERAGKTRAIRGEVVDARGHPVVGASVAANTLLSADSISIGVPLFDDEDDLRVTTTDDAGRFEISDFSDAAQMGAIAAQLADRRSRPTPIADHVRLVLEPTRSVSGKVELGGVPHTRVSVHGEVVGDPTGRFYLLAPVAADGSFVLDGATVNALRIGVAVRDRAGTGIRIEYQTYPASPAPIAKLRLVLPSSTRILDIIVRSTAATPIHGAQVILFPGKQQLENLGDVIRLQGAGVQSYYPKPTGGEDVPKAVLDKIRAGDLVAHVEHAGLGELTACAFSYPDDFSDPAIAERLQTHVAQLALRCVPIGPDATVVIVAVPPPQRFD